jgi:hypothetical protein
MLVAQVAKTDLLATAPEIFNRTEALVEVLAGSLSHGLANDMVESACWADDIRDYGLDFITTWHYQNRPYNVDGLINAQSETQPDALWALDQILDTLQSANQGELESAMMMRMLIHILGDIHQPLHIATMYSQHFATGDEGGNLYLIDYDANISELHALWDSGVGQLEADIPRPLSQQSRAQLEEQAKEFMETYSRSDLAPQLSETDREVWAYDIFHEALESVYADIQESSSPSQAYLKRGWGVVVRQIALGGYRLADLLKEVFAK